MSTSTSPSGTPVATASALSVEGLEVVYTVRGVDPVSYTHLTLPTNREV